jgi:ferredoxin
MRARVDEDACTGCGLCVEICPEVFEMDDDVAHVTVREIPEDFEDAVDEAADSCPVEAIDLDE